MRSAVRRVPSVQTTDELVPIAELEARFVGAVEEGLADADEGRVVDDVDLAQLIRRRYGSTPKARPRRR